MTKLLSTKISQLAKRLDSIPTLLGRKLGLTPETVERLRAALDEARFALYSEDEGYFSGEVIEPGDVKVKNAVTS